MNDIMNSGGGNDATMAADAPSKLTPEEKEQGHVREEQLHADLEIHQLPSLPPDERFKNILGMSTEAQVAVADSLRGGKSPDILEGLAPKQKETLLAMNYPPGVVSNELAQAKLLRAVYSERQFEEVMTDFWFNHFNVFVDKGLDRLMLTSYERDVIRPHALGKFEDLLVATARSPAMLFYLDNWLSVGPDSPKALGPAHPGRYPPQRPGKRTSGLNENYGRELLELHTLSVNGGYSQRDVTEVAKVFTGWTIENPAQGGGFKFDPRMHEPGPKFVLGRRIKPKYMAQTKARPPTFVLFANRADKLPESYRRYLINSIRQSFDLPGTPIRITVKSGKNPYDEGSDDPVKVFQSRRRALRNATK